MYEPNLVDGKLSRLWYGPVKIIKNLLPSSYVLNDPIRKSVSKDENITNGHKSHLISKLVVLIDESKQSIHFTNRKRMIRLSRVYASPRKRISLQSPNYRIIPTISLLAVMSTFVGHSDNGQSSGSNKGECKLSII